MKSKINFKFFSKIIYFPDEKIIAIGDLHLGYDEMLRKQGLNFPFNQLEETKREIKEIFEKLKKQGHSFKKIIILGDIKHHFGFEQKEDYEIKVFLKFLSRYVTSQNIILIKGNHEKFQIAGKKLKEFYIHKNITFAHGDLWLDEFNNEKIKTLILGHIHPAIWIKDKQGIKKEKYKCFLTGRYNKKQIIILPSFFNLIEGSEIKENINEKWKQAIPPKKLKNFNVFVIGENKIYEFGKLENLK